MKNALTLLKMLEISNYTQRHITVINHFLQSEEKDVKILLDKLGSWNQKDLENAEKWINL